MNRITVEMTIINLEAKIFFIAVHVDIESNTNFCGDEDIEGYILLKGNIVDEDGF